MNALGTLLAVAFSSASHGELESRLLHDAKQRAGFCQRYEHGCDYRTIRLKDGWLVEAAPIAGFEEGEKLYPLHGERIYLYSSEGRFKKMLRAP